MFDVEDPVFEWIGIDGVAIIVVVGSIVGVGIILRGAMVSQLLHKTTL